MRSRIRSGWRRASMPNTCADPSVGRMKSSSMLIVVDLPAPFGPRKPNISPSSIVRSRSSTATTSPKRFVSPCVSMEGILARDHSRPY